MVNVSTDRSLRMNGAAWTLIEKENRHPYPTQVDLIAIQAAQTSSATTVKIIHLPSYSVNPYQRYLITAQTALGHQAAEGGEGGNFFRTALFKWKADVLHFHWLHPYLLRPQRCASILRSCRFLAETTILRLTGTRLVWTIHNLSNHDNHQISTERFFSSAFARLCCLRIAHSTEAARLAEQHFRLKPSCVSVIPHPSYVGLYPDSITKEQARQQLQIPATAKVLLFIGRISIYKGITDLLDAFAALPESTHLIIVGDPMSDDLLSTLQAAADANPRIHLHARRFADEEIQTFMRAADIAVYPYRQILTSGAVILGMSFGSFAVAPDTPSLRETLHPQGAAFFKPGDRASLQAAIRNALDADLDAGGNLNYQRACEWSLQRIAAQTLQAIQQAIGR
jgi:glycosyltransferase involved in cell wall biosynthesis